MQSNGHSRTAAMWLFASNFLRHPYMLGSIIPSSRYLVNQVLEPIDWQRAKVIVEYGPGVGTFTHEILQRMAADAVLIAIEMNGEFVRFLGKSFRDPRLIVVQDSAANVRQILQRHGHETADYIISGIPLSSLPEPLCAAIAESSRAALARDGVLLVYQFTRRALPVLERTFGTVRRSREHRNVPPAHFFMCGQ